MMAFDLLDPTPAIKAENLYDIIRPIASGSIAEVWLARTVGPEQCPVVIKKLLPHLAQDPEFLRIFTEEIRLASGLRHPDIASVLDFGRSGETWFVATDYVPGCTLNQIQRQLRSQHKAMPAWLVLTVMLTVCSALQAAHAQDVLHRDLRPENIIVSEQGQTVVLDFGIARAASASSIGQRTIPRKLAYAAPETIHEDPRARADCRTDVYSAGVVLYEMLTGVRPFKGTSEFALARCILEDNPLPPNEAARWVPARLSDIVMRAIARDAEQRFSSAEELGSELESFMRALRVVPTKSRLADFMNRLSVGQSDNAPASSAEPVPSSQRMPPPPACFQPEDIEVAQGLQETADVEVDSLDINWDSLTDDAPASQPGVKPDTADQPTMASELGQPLASPPQPTRIVILKPGDVQQATETAPARAAVAVEPTLQTATLPLPAASNDPVAADQTAAPSPWDSATQRATRTGQTFEKVWQRANALQAGSEPAAVWDRLTAKARQEADEGEKAVEQNPQSQPARQSNDQAVQPSPESSKAAQVWDRIASREARTPTRLPQLEAMDAFDRGLELVRERKYEEALRVWEGAIALDPNNTRLVTNAKRLRDRLTRGE